MYEKDGESTSSSTPMHYWNAAPDNWVEGAEQYAKGWIECFYGYHGLGPEDTRWPLEKYQKYSEEDLMKRRLRRRPRRRGDLPAHGPDGVVQGGLQHHRARRDPVREAPGQVHPQHPWDPREGEDGLKTLRHNVERWGCKGVKLYTAEWRQGSRGWKLTDPEAYKYLEACEELGIRNIHVHKGPTIWPLDKDAFDMADVDHAATDFPGLNFIVEHSGIRASTTSATWRRRSRTCTRVCPWWSAP